MKAEIIVMPELNKHPGSVKSTNDDGSDVRIWEVSLTSNSPWTKDYYISRRISFECVQADHATNVFEIFDMECELIYLLKRDIEPNFFFILDYLRLKDEDEDLLSPELFLEAP